MKIALRMLPALFLLTTLFAYGQGTVTGKVTTAEGESLPGVNVVLKGTTTGTITDVDGNYSLPASSGTLVFSFIGYKDVEVEINGQTVVNITMEEDITTLEQVVVIGYGEQKRKDIATAVVVVDEKSIENRPMVSAGEALQGKAAGVYVVSPSGKPGADLSIRIRGTGSLLGSNEPLYVVDGVITYDIRGLNPQDIASLTVLKDAAATAIYGVRGGNGVVIITTKRGKANTPVVRFNAYAGFSKIGKTLDVLNTDQYRDLMEEVLGPGTVDPSITTYTNWPDKVFGTGSNQSYQLSLSGGSEKSQYMISGNYLNVKGIVEPAEFRRYSLRLNIDNQVKDWLKVGTSLNFLSSKTEDTPDNLSSGRGGVIMSALNTPPFLNIYKDDGSGQFDPNPFQPSWENPYAYMFGTDTEALDNRLFGNITGEVKFFKYFRYNINLGVDLNMHFWDSFTDPLRTTYGRQQNGAAASDKSFRSMWLLENTLTYTTSFGESNLTALIGTSQQENRSHQSYLSGTDFPPDGRVRTLSGANIISGTSNRDEYAYASFFGRVNYDLQGKYLFSAALRRDAASILANPWENFPSVALGWRIGEESFLDAADFITDLKLRASWGKTGNSSNFPNYSEYGLVNYVRRAPTDPLSGPAAVPATYGNKDLRWEVTTQTDLGFDLVTFDGRLTFTFDAYRKLTEDLLVRVNLPTSLPISFIDTNAGSLENKGLEFTLSTINLQGKELTWNTDFNMSFNKNEIIEFGLDPTAVYYDGRIYSNNQDVSIVRTGMPVGTFWGYVSQGVDPATGDIIYQDRNNNGVIDPQDRTAIGYGLPKMIYGFTNTLRYKAFDLSLFFQGTHGNDIFNSTRIDLEGMFDSKNQSTVVLDRWTPDNTDTNVPRAGEINNVRNSTRFVENGSYLRLKQVTLSYNLNPDMLKKVGINRMSLYTTGQNLLTFTNYSGFDPEVNAFGNNSIVAGVDYGTYPQAKTVTFGVNIEF
jgi:TonB-dependent starch-binding outer membrane protein SusC